MNEETPKKFVYKKDRLDWILIFIIIFTLACFGFIFYGMTFFENRDTTRTITDHSQLQELIDNRSALEQQIREELEQ